MDQSTHEVRIANWKSVIEQCQSRPQGQTTRQWLAENGIPEKSYYYWLRKIRKMTYCELQAQETLPAIPAQQVPAVAFAEIQAQGILQPESEPAITIKTKKSTIQISTVVPEDIMVKLVKAVSHAL